jgi:hypothetical protein
MTPLAKTAIIVETLVEYDGPQLLLLKTNRGYNMISVAVKDQHMEEPFFGCEINDKTYDGYFEQTWDLHYTFRHAIGRRYYLLDAADSGDDGVKLAAVSDERSIDESFWPQIGFFSRSHTTDFNRILPETSEKTFRIDGKWDASDFSQFYGKMADLYALFGAMSRLDKVNGDAKATEKGFVTKIIHERYWRGGGSYVGFYDSLMERNSIMQLARLDVAKIQYASPGELKLRGNRDALSSVTTVMSIFDEKAADLKTVYRTIYGILKKERLLSAPPNSQFGFAHIERLVLDRSKVLSKEIGIDNVDEVFDACEQNVLVFAKLVLSMYRRAYELYKYQDEGRVRKS